MDMNLLLVDDEEGIRKVLGISLEDSGYIVHTAENGEKALEVFRKIAPPIVLCDIKMPGMDGIELLQHIKHESPDTEVIMITGHGDMDLAVKSLKYEATDFVTKPIHEEVLEIALKRAYERLTMRRQLREYTEKLELLVEEKSRKLIEAERMAAIGETVAGLSHAIKNIAGGLKGGLFVLEKGIELDDKTYVVQGWEMVKGNVDKIRNLSLELLNYGKSADMDFQNVHPNTPAEDVIHLLEASAKERQIDLKADLTNDLSPISMNYEAIHRCLMNLVTNALDACDIEKGDALKHKQVILKTVKSEGWGVEYQIIDNGCGMDENTIHQIFRSFFSTKGHRGTGIGLMISKKIVEQHKGNIHVTSKKDEGTTFIIRLQPSSLSNQG